MRLLRVLGLATAAVIVVGTAAGAVYLFSLLRLWGAAVRATDPFDAGEPV